MYNCIRTSLAALLLMASAAFAQSQPQLLSAPDRRNYQLPVANQIQSAGSIGGTTCAVWGTTINLDSGVVADHLVMQRVREGSAIGTPVAVGSPVARPFGNVRVVPVSGNFLVIWNDRRSADSGVYCRVFDTNGVASGNELQLSPGSMAGVPYLAESLSGVSHVIWNDTTGIGKGVWMLRMSSDGSIDSVWSYQGDVKVTDAMRYDFLPGSLLLFHSNGGGWFFDDAGRMDLRPVVSNTGERPFLLQEDSAYVTVTGSRLEFRAGVFDSTVTRSVVLPGLDSALVGAVSLGRDSVGGYVVRYWVMWYIPGSRYIRQIRQITTDANGNPLGTLNLWEQTHWVYTCPYCKPMYLVYTGTTRSFGCNNSELLTIGFDITSEDRTLKSSELTGIDENGTYVRLAGSLSLCAAIPSSVPISRLPGISTSRVTLTTQKPVVLEQSLGWLGIPVDDCHPFLLLSEGKIVAGWVSAGDSLRLAAALWNPTTGELQRLAESLVKEGPYADALGQPPVENGYYDERDSPHAMDGIGGFTRSYRRTDQFIIRYNQSHRISKGIAALWHFRPVATGWRSSEHLKMSEEFVVPVLYQDAVASDPLSGSILMSVRHSLSSPQYPETRSVFLFAPDAGVRFRVDNVSDSLTGIALVSFGGTEFGLVRGSILERWNSTGLINRGNLEFADTNARFHSMLDGTFLSLAQVDGRLRIRRFDRDGRQQAMRDLELDVQPARLFVVQKRVDSSITLVWSGSSGVHATFLAGRSLALLVDDTVLCASGRVTRNPAAIYLNDTLLLAWEETHDGSSDIYGSSVEIPPMREPTTGVPSAPDVFPATPNSDAPGNQVPMITTGPYPNPTRGTVTLEFELPFHSSVTFEIFSIEGGMVKRIEAGDFHSGKNSAAISIDDVLPGTYYLTVRSDFGSSTTKLAVVPVR